MKKISTPFKKDPDDLGRVINEVNPENQWVFDGEAVPTRKYDGTACAVINGNLYRRYDAKPRYKRPIPAGAIPCQEPDHITGHWPHWVLVDPFNPNDAHHVDAFTPNTLKDGTYELCGPHFQGNPEGLETDQYIRHGEHELLGLVYPLTFDGLKNYLENVNIEGIVFHHKSGDGRMCKLRKSDFGIKR